MNFNIRNFLGRPLALRSSILPAKRSRKPRLSVQNLEDRVTPATFTVNNVLDDGSVGSLRWAITQANAASGADEVVFDSTFFATPRTISLATALPQISNGDLTLTNTTGASRATVTRSASAGANFGIFSITTTSANVTFDGITISGGNAGLGSAISSSLTSKLSVKNSVLIGNTGGKGTISLPSGATGLLTVQNTTISGNTGVTGGIYFVKNGSLLLQNSTISGNTGTGTASYHGGGILFFGTVGSAGFTIENSTIDGNSTSSSSGGGGINFRNAFGSAIIRNTTITRNTGPTNATGGGGIGVSGGSLGLTLASTIVAENVGPSDGPDLRLSAGVATATDSLIGVLPPANFNDNGNLTGTSGSPLDPLLLSLQDNGGPTFTREPSSESPVLNAGANPTNLFSDQRGLGFRRIFDGGVDIGAVERQPKGTPYALASTTNVDNTDVGETVYTFEVTFADPAWTNNGIDVSTVIGNNNAIRVTGPNGFDQLATFVSIDDETNGTPRSATYSITPPGGAWNNFDTGSFSVHTEPNTVFDIDGLPIPAESVGAFAVVLTPYVVTNANDEGNGSLRQAITLATASPDNDVIEFDPAFFNTPRVIDLVSALPYIFASGGGLTIAGPGAANLTVDAGDAFRVLDSGAPTLNLSGFTITGGLASFSNGGGLLASGNVTVDGMVFEGNAATGGSWIYAGNGGAIAMHYGSFLTVRNTTISGNTAGSNGGGIGFYWGGSLVVENSTISGNSSTFPGNPYGYYSNYIGYYGGGGIMFNGSISTAPPAGFIPGVVVIRNSTIANNTTTGSGGGIDMHTYSGTLLVQNSTVSGNTASATGTSPWGYPYGGGGIKRLSFGGEISIANSVVAGNTNASIPDIGSLGTVLVNSSAIGDTTGFTLTGANNILNTDPMLGPLQDNGGPTHTMAPLPGSPLIDAGSGDFVPAGAVSDQRGFGFYRTYYAGVDIGAVEDQLIGGPFVVADIPDAVPGATSHQFTVTYADPNGTNNGIDVSTLINNDNAVRVTGPFGFDVLATYVGIDDASDGAPRTVTYSFTPPGGSWNNLDNGAYSFQMQASQVADIDGNYVLSIPLGRIDVIIPPIIVTNANDSGDGSLRSAILLANSTPADDFIAFDPGFFNTQQSIDLVTALPTISATGGGLTITGPGADILSIDAGEAFRVLDSQAPTLELSGMTITGGTATNGYGGGLRAGGTVTIDDMVFTENPNSVAGGAIAMTPGSYLAVRDSTIADNSASFSGGGIFFQYGGSLLLENSTVSGNSTSYTGNYYGTFGGGGIYFHGAVANGTVPEGFVPGRLVVRNSTIANNTTTGSGGGLFTYYFFGSWLVQNSTISGNNADAAKTGFYGPYYGGGGISSLGSLSYNPLIVKNSIISDNTNRNAPDIQWVDPVIADSSAIGSADGHFLSPLGANNIIGAELNLGPLQDNGGPTQTIALGAGSAAIDAGSDVLIPIEIVSDQRGFGYYRFAGDTVDIGAFEVQPVGGPFAFATTPEIVPGASIFEFTVTYTDPFGSDLGIDVSTLIGNDNAIRVTGPDGIDLPATFVAIDDNTNGTPRTVTYSITPPGGTWSNYDTGYYAVRTQTDQVMDLDGNFAVAASVGHFDVLISPFVVMNANDSGEGSLRAVIALANSLPQDDFIVFDPEFFNAPRTIDLLTELPKISAGGGGLTITGPGAELLTLDAGGEFRVLESQAPTLNLSGFTITGGMAANDNGGGLWARGVVTLDGMVVTGNAATGHPNYYTGTGGGIGMDDFGYLTIRNSTISGNTAGANGGGIGFYWGGGLVVENSTISGNSTTFDGSWSGYYGGGGIGFIGRISNSPPEGFTPGVVVIRNSTIANNFTPGSGGGLLGYDIDGSFLLQNCTITGNTAEATGSTYYGYPFGGGGVAIIYDGDIVVQNSVITGNINVNGPDIVSYYSVRTSFSLIGNTNGFDEQDGTGNLAPNTDPKLGPLQDNGGPTLTRAPLPGSPLMNAGSSALLPVGMTSDQRGEAFVREYGSAVDIGSVEVQPTKVTINQAVGQADPTNGSTITFAVHFNSAVTGFDGSDIDFAGSTVSGTLVATVTGSGMDYSVAIAGMTGEGTVVASFPAGAATDLFGSASEAPTSTDNSVTFDGVAPTATIDRADGQADPAVVGPVIFSVHFSEVVTGFDGSDLSFAGSTVGGTLDAIVTGSGADYTVTVSGMSGEGSVIASIPASSTTDAAGNANTESTSTDNTVVFDGILPSVTINQAVGQSDPTNVASITFDVKFSEIVTGFDASDVSLIGSTAGGTLLASVSGSGDTYTVTVTGMTSRGVVTVSVPAGVAVDAAGNLNLASTSTDNSVEFVKSGTVSLDSAVYSVNLEEGTIRVTVSRTGGNEGPVTIQFATSDGTAHSGGLAADGQADFTPFSETLTWLDGQDGDKTFDIPILVDDLNEGKEIFTLALTPLTGSATLGITAATVEIAPSDGEGPGKYLDQDGDKYTIKLNGKTGSMLYFRTDPDGDRMGPIELIELTDTLPDPLKPKAVLVITVTKSKTSEDGGTVGLGAITGPGLKSISARKANLNGAGILLDGYLGALTIGDITSGADITTLETTNSKQKTRINARAIGSDTAIRVGADISSLTATSFGAGSVQAPNIGVMTIKGDMAANVDVTGAIGVMTIKGDMSADVNVDGVDVEPTKKALTRLKVKGVVTGSDIFVNGDVGTVTVGAFRDSRLFAGYTGADDGTGTFHFPATVTAFKATGKTDGFQNSRVIATNLKSATITHLDSTNDENEFGFYVKKILGSVKVLGPTKFKYDATTPTPPLDDFGVRIV